MRWITLTSWWNPRRGWPLAVWVWLGFGGLALLFQLPTHADQYFASGMLQFSKREYALRRERLCAAVADGLILIPSADYPSAPATFRQDSTFLYFTGLEVPRGYLLFDAATRHEILYLPARDKRFYPAGHEHLTRRGRTLYPDPEILSRSGLREIAPLAQLTRDLENGARTSKIIWIDLGPNEESMHKESVLGFPPGRETLLATQLQQRFPASRVKNLYPALASLRSAKSEAELRVMRKVSALGASGLVHAMQTVRPGLYERALEAVLTFAYKRGGAQNFPTALTVRSGPNSLLLGSVLAANYDRRNRPMQAGELVVIDASCELNYYTTAVTRTVPVSGQFSDEQREVYRAALAASQAALAAVRPGVTLKQIEDVALAAVPARYRHWWDHGIGHSIGLDVMDPADLTRPLTPGMTLTMEPRLYLPERGFAVAIGDVVLVTPGGGEVLTGEAPKDPARIEELVSRKRAFRPMQ